MTTVRALMAHPMIRGSGKNQNGEQKTSPHFIQEVTCECDKKTVLTALWSDDIAKNPFIAFKFKGGNRGGMIRLTWVDNLGNSASVETRIS